MCVGLCVRQRGARGPRQPSIPGWSEVSTGFSERERERGKQGAEPPGGRRLNQKFSSVPPLSLVTPTSVFLSAKTARWRADVTAGAAESRLDGIWRSVREGAGEWGRACEWASVGLSRLHLQQSQHGRVVPQLHPALGGQAHVFSQVVHGSWAERQNSQSDRWMRPETYVSFTLMSSPPPSVKAKNRLWQNN